MQLTQEQQLVSHDLLIGNENRRGGEGQWEGPLKVREPSTSLHRYGRLQNISPLNFYWFRFGRIAPCLALVLTTLVALHFSGNLHFKLNTTNYSVVTAVVHVLTFRFNILLVHFGWNINRWNVLYGAPEFRPPASLGPESTYEGRLWPYIGNAALRWLAGD